MQKNIQNDARQLLKVWDEAWQGVCGHGTLVPPALLPSSPSKPQVAERTTLHNAHDQLCIKKVKYILSVTISHVHLDDDSNGTQPPSCFGKITTQKGNL